MFPNGTVFGQIIDSGDGTTIKIINGNYNVAVDKQVVKLVA